MNKITPFTVNQVQSILDTFSVGTIIQVQWLETQYIQSLSPSKKTPIFKAVITTNHGVFYLVGIDPVFSPFHGLESLQDFTQLSTATLVQAANNIHLTHRFDLYFYLFKKTLNKKVEGGKAMPDSQ